MLFQQAGESAAERGFASDAILLQLSVCKNE